MNWLAINTVAYIITFSLVFHFSVISVQLWALVAEGFISRRGFLGLKTFGGTGGGHYG